MVNRVAAAFACIVVSLVGWSFAFAEDAKAPPSLGQRYKDFIARTDSIIVVSRYVVGKVESTEIACCIASRQGQAEAAFAVQLGKAYVDFDNVPWCQETIDRVAGAIKAEGENETTDSVSYRHRGLGVGARVRRPRDSVVVYLEIDSYPVCLSETTEQLALVSGLLKQSREKLITLGAK